MWNLIDKLFRLFIILYKNRGNMINITLICFVFDFWSPLWSSLFTNLIGYAPIDNSHSKILFVNGGSAHHSINRKAP
ncbi:hypothetical protein L1887_14911 [Cichorium endivia]|nr:hypothetical protein L1887_14911 [Cichorium endivia]